MNNVVPIHKLIQYIPPSEFSDDELKTASEYLLNYKNNYNVMHDKHWDIAHEIHKRGIDDTDMHV